MKLLYHFFLTSELSILLYRLRLIQWVKQYGNQLNNLERIEINEMKMIHTPIANGIRSATNFFIVATKYANPTRNCAVRMRKLATTKIIEM